MAPPYMLQTQFTPARQSSKHSQIEVLGNVYCAHAARPAHLELKWSNHSGHLIKGINYPNEVNNESRKTNQKAV